MILTGDKLVKILSTNKNAIDWYGPIASFLPDYRIDTDQRVAAFLAQVTHESSDFTHLRENLNYKAAALITTWPKRFNTTNAPLYEHNQEKIANCVYANRLGNKDEASGDGWKFRGRGPIQITGKNNYLALSLSLFKDERLLDTPELLETDFSLAVQSACWFWDTANLNALADLGNIKEMTKRINGGYIGLEDRQARYDRILAILKEPDNV